MQIRVRYYAELKELAGREQQALTLQQGEDLVALYQRLRVEHGFRFPQQALRVAINGRLVGWEQALADGDEIDLLPPYSGG